MALARPFAAQRSDGGAFSAPLSVSPSLAAAADTPRLATPIAPRRTPHRPAPRCLDARLATIARQRMHRPKQPFAALQQTSPHSWAATAINRALIADPMRVILEVAQGRSHSRKVMSRRGASNSSSRRLLNSQSSLHLNPPHASAPTVGMPPDRHQALADHPPWLRHSGISQGRR